MLDRETAQQLDPLSGITARFVATALAIVSIATAVYLTITASSQVSSVPLQILALTSLLAAHVYLFWATEPYRRRVTRARYSVAFGLVLLACIFDSLSQVGSDTASRDDWGPICVALLLMIAGSYRPMSEILVLTGVALVVIAASTVVHSGTLHERTMFVALTIASSPTLALGVGTAVYSRYLVASIHRERRFAADARERRDQQDRRAAIEEFLGHDVESLRREVLPFFRDLKTRDALTEDDISRSADLSAALRASLVSSLASDPLEEVVASFDDPARIANRLTEPQRVALRTLLVYLGDQPTVRRSDLALNFTVDDQGPAGTVEVRCTPDRTLTSGVSPFVGLVQLAFADVSTETTAEQLTVSFRL